MYHFVDRRAQEAHLGIRAASEREICLQSYLFIFPPRNNGGLWGWQPGRPSTVTTARQEKKDSPPRDVLDDVEKLFTAISTRATAPKVFCRVESPGQVKAFILAVAPPGSSVFTAAALSWKEAIISPVPDQLLRALRRGRNSDHTSVMVAGLSVKGGAARRGARGKTVWILFRRR